MIGVRFFYITVNGLGRIRLASRFSGEVFKEDSPAICLSAKPRHSPMQAAPVEDCLCGYYAYFNGPLRMDTLDYSTDNEGHYSKAVISAVVWGWGKVIEHQRGWRAQRMKILHLVTPICPKCNSVMSVAQSDINPWRSNYLCLVCPNSSEKSTILNEFTLDDLAKAYSASFIESEPQSIKGI